MTTGPPRTMPQQERNRLADRESSTRFAEYTGRQWTKDRTRKLLGCTVPSIKILTRCKQTPRDYQVGDCSSSVLLWQDQGGCCRPPRFGDYPRAPQQIVLSRIRTHSSVQGQTQRRVTAAMPTMRLATTTGAEWIASP